MRVLYIIPAERFGGAERQAVYHMRLLPQLGIEVVPLVGPGTLILDQLREEGVDHVEFTKSIVQEYGRPYHTLDFSQYVASTTATWVVAQPALRDLLRRHAIDAIFASRVTGWVMVGLLARSLHIPQIWRVGSRPANAMEQNMFRWYAALARPEGIVCNCEALKRDIAPLVNAANWVVYNGVDTDRFNPASEKPLLRKQLEIPTGRTVVIGVAARPSPGKGLETLADALLLLNRSARKVQVIVAGDYGWRDHYHHYFVQRGLGEQVRMLGYVERIELFLRSCDIVVLPSHGNSSEGLPNAILEAMSMRRPVIGTQVGGIDEAIIDGETGLLVPPDNPCALVEAMRRLIDSASLRRTLGHRGRERVLRLFSLQAVGKRLAEVITSVIDTHHHAAPLR